MLSEQALAYRRDKITASDARVIMNARSDAELLALFDRKTGAADPEPETYAMRAGTAMEPVIIAEFERTSGETLNRRQEIVDHPTIQGFCCTLDGWQTSQRRVIEVKFASPFIARDELFRNFYGQVAFAMACTDADAGLLVIGQGTAEPFEIECIRDPFHYERELLERCTAFLFCLSTLTPPCARPVVVPPERWRTVDVSKETTNWSSELLAALVEYEQTAAAAVAHEHWGTVARELVPDDVGRVLTGDYTLSRNKKGTISIRKAAA